MTTSYKHVTKLSLFVFVYAHAILSQPIIAHSDSALFTTELPGSFEPETIIELQSLVQQARQEKKKISLVGAGKSMGGQTVPALSSDYRIDLKKLNKLINLNVQKKEVTVQAGMTWRQLQQYIAPHKLAIKSMQSYHDFSIGGSLSVNIHGQSLQYAPIVGTVISCTLLQHDGTLITVSRQDNKELFGLIIGGYGLFGIIVDVTLSLTDDILLERKATIVASEDLAEYFKHNIQNNPNIEFYSARFLLTKPYLLDSAFVITYEKSSQNKPELFALNTKPTSNFQRIFLTLTAKLDSIKFLRFPLEKMYLRRPEIISKNNFTNITIESLPAHTASSQYFLQEYFIPYAHLHTFINKLREVITNHSINMINVTARHVHQDLETKLSFAPQDCCALVLYISIERKPEHYKKTIQWTRELIDEACACAGSYYLPYQLLATQQQLETAYPAFKEFVALKKKYDPQELFSNKLYQQYAASI